MSLSAGVRRLDDELGKAGMSPESIETRAALTFEKTDAGFAITTIHLDVRAKVPGADPAAFQKAADDAKRGCPVSRVLNTKITMTATLA